MFRASPLPKNNQGSNRSGNKESIRTTTGHASIPDPSFPIDLIRFSIQAEQRKKQNNQQSYTSLLSDELVHAAPQSSLNYRDVMVLDELFLREDMSEIAGDVDQMLERFMPAPCWEDDAFNFLGELL